MSNVGKVLKVSNDIVTIGLDDGGLKEVRPSDVNFSPNVGDKVEVFGDETNLVITKFEETPTPVINPEPATNSINVTIDQSNTGVGQTYVAGGKVVNKVAYVLLAIFLGGLGAHKFYSGKVGTGVVYLIFCWTFIPAIIGFIEGIIGLTKNADNNGNILV